MAIQQVTREIYDANGHVRTEIMEVNVPDVNEEIQSKEEELLRVYAEIQALKELRDAQQ
jgi:hypothetical protein